MFEYQPKRHPLQTFQFWFLIMVCLAGVGAWQMGMLPIPDLSLPIAGRLEQEPMPPPPKRTADDLPVEDHLQVTEFPFAPIQEEEYESAPLQTAEVPRDERILPQPELPVIAPEVPPEKPIEIMTLSGESPVPEAVAIQNTNLTQPAEFKFDQPVPPRELENQTARPVLSAADVPSATNRRIQPASLDFSEVDALTELGDDVAALRQLSIWYWERPVDRPKFQDRLNVLSRRIYFQPQPHYMDPYTVTFGDRFETIARTYHVPWEYLSKINRTPPEKLRAGQKLKVIRGPFSVVVDLSDLELTVHSHGYYVVRMPVGIGKDESTPIGTFHVTDKVVNPIYYGPDEVIAADDPQNPLGEYWLAFSDEKETLQGFGLHGTIDPTSIGKAESRGCVRLHNQDIEDLYHLLSINSEIVIRR